MGKLKDFFRPPAYVFLMYSDNFCDDTRDLGLKEDAHGYIRKCLKSVFRRQRIQYVDYYTNKENLKSYTILTTFDPKSNRKFLPAVYEIYAFTQLEDIRIFSDYKTEVKEFSNESNTIKVLKFKL